MATPPSDQLKVDPIDPSQQWTVISYISPDRLIEERMIWELNKFLVDKVNEQIDAIPRQLSMEVNVRIRKEFEKRMDRYRGSSDPADREMLSLIEGVQNKLLLNEGALREMAHRAFKPDPSDLKDSFRMYQATNHAQLAAEFGRLYPDAVATQAFKVRRCFPTEELAQAYARSMRDYEPQVHTFVGQVGYWLAIDNNPDKVSDQKYSDPQLEELMRQYHENIERSNAYHEKRREMDLMESQSRSNHAARDRLRQKVAKKKLDKERAELERLIARRALYEDKVSEDPDQPATTDPAQSRGSAQTTDPRGPISSAQTADPTQE